MFAIVIVFNFLR